MSRPALFVVSGNIETGKTRFMLLLAQAMQVHAWDVAGIVSPANFQNNAKIAIDAMDLRSGKRGRLAELIQAGSQLQGPTTSRWQFSQETLDWANSLLRSATPCDALMIDELGPLEFKRGEGLASGIEAVEGGEYLAAVVVVRSTLLPQATRRWPHHEAIALDRSSNDLALVARWAQRLLRLKV